MIETLLGNPIMAIIVIIIAVIIGKLFKLSMKIIKWIILIGIAYFIVTTLNII